MYFPSIEELRYVHRGLLPEARRQPVAEELRGWNWHEPPLKPIYRQPLAAHEVAGKYCPTGRDVYLRRVQGIQARPNVGMREGRVFHALLADLVTEAKRRIFAYGAACVAHLEELSEHPLPETNEVASAMDAQIPMAARLQALRAFETRRIVERVEAVLAHYPRIGRDALAALALPVNVEIRLDGRFLGLSEYLAADAVAFRDMLIFDLKFGPREPFHRLTTTGYALVVESLFESPIDLGCIVYVRFVDGRVVVERDFHLIDDELRQEFIEERDGKMRLVANEWDPGLPAECPRTCPYLTTCHPTEEIGVNAVEGGVAANRRRRSAKEPGGPEPKVAIEARP